MYWVYNSDIYYFSTIWQRGEFYSSRGGDKNNPPDNLKMNKLQPAEILPVFAFRTIIRNILR